MHSSVFYRHSDFPIFNGIQTTYLVHIPSKRVNKNKDLIDSFEILVIKYVWYYLQHDFQRNINVNGGGLKLDVFVYNGNNNALFIRKESTIDSQTGRWTRSFYKICNVHGIEIL